MSRTLPQSLSLLLLVGCGDAALPPLAPAPADLEVIVTEKHVGEGEDVLVEVRSWAGSGWNVPATAPLAEGLTVSNQTTDGPTRVGDRDRTVQSFTLSGPPGSYIVAVPPVHAAGPNDQTRELAPPPIFVDIGVDGPLAKGISDFEGTPPPEPPPTKEIALAVLAAVLLFGGIGGFLWWRSRQPVPVIPPPPPHVTALGAWDAARAAGLDDHALALALSAILRQYFESTDGWPATSRTTREILAWLQENGRLGEADRVRAAHVLDATDRLKFAREGGGGAFFTALDQDFRAVVDAMRPRLPSSEAT
jgi:hypothetical protein